MPQLDLYTFPTQIFALFFFICFFLFLISYLFTYYFFFESEVVEKEYLFFKQQLLSKKFEKIFLFTSYRNSNSYFLLIYRLFF